MTVTRTPNWRFDEPLELAVQFLVKGLELALDAHESRFVLATTGSNFTSNLVPHASNFESSAVRRFSAAVDAVVVMERNTVSVDVWSFRSLELSIA
jgi:hypothetical protein